MKTNISTVLTRLHQNPEFHNDLTLGKLLDLLEDQSYGIGTLIFALPSILPSTAIPGVSLIFGAPILFLGIQLAFFRKKPWVPQWLRAKKLNSKSVASYIKKAIPYIQKAEKIIKPRYAFFRSGIMNAVTGIVLVFLSILLMLPIPFSNVPLGLLISMIALGLIESDGLLLLFSFICSYFTITFYSAVIHWFIDLILKL